MSSLNLMGKAIAKAPFSLAKEPESRLSITMLITALDIAVLLIMGPVASECASISIAVPIAFAVASAALLASLAHMWMLTLGLWID
jgi:hypothetical protein